MTSSGQGGNSALAEISGATFNAPVGKHSVPFPVGAYSYPIDQLDWPTYWPRRLLGDDFFVRVDFVEFFYFPNESVRDAMLESVKGLRDLRKLRFQQTDNLALEHLGPLTQLRELSIRDSSVTDDDLEHLKTLTQLTNLNLDCPKVSDTGLNRLKSLTCLQELHLFDTNVTAAGVESTQRALPHCKIEWSPPTAPAR